MSEYRKPKPVQPEHQKDLESIGLKLKELRTKKGVSASELSEEIKISRNSYGQMEKGMIYFSTQNFLRLLDYHEISIKTFFAEL